MLLKAGMVNGKIKWGNWEWDLNFVIISFFALDVLIISRNGYFHKTFREKFMERNKLRIRKEVSFEEQLISKL